MFGLPLAFAAPAALAALVALFALVWLLRVTPPRPRTQVFPPIRLLLGLESKEITAFRTPWPLLVLRLAIATLVVLAMAGPIWRALASATTRGALLIVLDDGWPAAPAWERRIALARETAAAVARAGRLVALAPLSHGAQEIISADGETIETKLAALAPVSYAPPRAPAMTAISHFLAAHEDAQVLWIADGLDLGQGDAFAQTLSGHSVEVAADPETPLALVGAESLPASLDIAVTRADSSGRRTGTVRAYDSHARSVGEATFDFANKTTATARFELPVEVRNDIVRLAIEGVSSAGAAWLVDERARRRRVAVVAGGSADLAEPLLAPTYYITRALAPFADVREAKPGATDPIGNLLAEQPSALALVDMNVAQGPDHDKIVAFVEGGGVVIRFAGSRTAAADDDLIPTQLRRGGRTLGGALSWDTPKHVAPFEAPSPFVGIKVPEDVTVLRQVLAEPVPGLPGKTWARLADGTPLVTAVRRGKGLVVLFHITADTTWSNLPLSGLFVEMMRRIVAEASAAATEPNASTNAVKAVLPPWRTLDGFGILGTPPGWAKPLPAGFSGAADGEHPPGLYGAAESAFAVNALAEGATLTPARFTGLKLRAAGLATTPPIDLKPWLLLLAFFGFLVDCIASLNVGNPLWGSRFRRAAPLALALLFLGSSSESRAVGVTDEQAATATRLAYVLTGDAEVDETSRLGLEQLTHALDQRTSAALSDPVALDPSRDELAFYPLIYWPIAARQSQPPAAVVARISAFMRNGGTVIFDTRDALNANGGVTPETLWLRKLLAGVDVPELEPVPADHVVTKTFYLLDGFVGRTENGQTWIEALPPIDPKERANRPARAGDSVSPVIITSNDLAAAWASREDGSPLYPLVPGSPRQREMALRGGINLVMYALTGNYKADQVHARDLLERLAR